MSKNLMKPIAFLLARLCGGEVIAPSQEELVLNLIVHTASLELKKGEFRWLAPVKGTCGQVKLSGNSLPVIEYRVFDKKIMEFIAVRVEISRPDRIDFICTIDSQYTADPANHGKEVESTDKFKEPGFRLMDSFYNYFPLVREENLICREIPK